MKPEFGLNQKTLDTLFRIFNQYPNISHVLVYGSRAKGNFNERSDLDLVIMDQIDRKILGSIWMDINSSDFPLTVDLQVWNEIKNENLKDHIQRLGKTFYISKGISV